MPALLRLLTGLLAVAAITAHAADPELKRAENAVRVLNEIMQAPDKAIPRELLQSAHAIVVVPDVLKAGFVIGGRRGEGLIAVKTRDGTKGGYNLPLTRAIADAVAIPVIASGGVGTLDHLVEGITQGHASAVLAASIFHFGTYTIGQAKAHMAAAGIPVRLS